VDFAEAAEEVEALADIGESKIVERKFTANEFRIENEMSSQGAKRGLRHLAEGGRAGPSVSSGRAFLR